MSLVDNAISQPTAAILIIGDEILSGRTQDINGNFLAKKLSITIRFSVLIKIYV